MDVLLVMAVLPHVMAVVTTAQDAMVVVGAVLIVAQDVEEAVMDVMDVQEAVLVVLTAQDAQADALDVLVVPEAVVEVAQEDVLEHVKIVVLETALEVVLEVV